VYLRATVIWQSGTFDGEEQEFLDLKIDVYCILPLHPRPPPHLHGGLRCFVFHDIRFPSDDMDLWPSGPLRKLTDTVATIFSWWNGPLLLEYSIW
jgi:hypothetical protein